jgi:hypothetical protein
LCCIGTCFFACRLRIDDDVDDDEHHMNLQVFSEVLHRLLEELLLCPFFLCNSSASAGSGSADDGSRS